MRWHRAFRWILAALVLTLLAPAAAAARLPTDHVVVVAAQTSAEVAPQTREAEEPSPAPRPRRWTRLAPRPSTAAPYFERAPLYLLVCALLR
jgi:hypothetical protein